MPAAVMGDMCTCVGPPDTIILGSIGVMLGGKPAARMGDMCGHGGSIVAGLPTVLIGEIGISMTFGPVLSMEQVAMLFFLLSNIDSIAFKFPRDGCYARAQIMANLMSSLGATPQKAWTFASDPSDPLWVNSPNVPEGKVEWGYHVAPTVQVTQPDGSVQSMVVDPSMYDHPVTLDQWVADQHDHPHVVQTDPGQPPTTAGGSGYWPAPDPAEGADIHAFETMEDYKLREGT
jgi:hypothetical protein